MFEDVTGFSRVDTTNRTDGRENWKEKTCPVLFYQKFTLKTTFFLLDGVVPSSPREHKEP